MEGGAPMSAVTRKKASRIREGVGSRVFDVINYILLVIVGLLCLVPFLHVFAVSLSSNGAALSQKVFILPV